MAEIISSTEAARHLGDLLARVKNRGDRFILTRNNRAVAELHAAPSRRGTLGEVLGALQKLPVEPGFADDLQQVNRTDAAPDHPWR